MVREAGFDSESVPESSGPRRLEMLEKIAEIVRIGIPVHLIPEFKAMKKLAEAEEVGAYTSLSIIRNVQERHTELSDSDSECR